MDRDVAAVLEEYVRVRGQRLVRTAYLLTGDREIAEDLVQNVLASALVSWRRLRDVNDMDAYMYTALVHARSRWWSRHWQREIPSEEVPDTPMADATAQFDSHSDILAVLRQIPTRQRQAIVLRYFDDLTEAQTAQILDCSIGTVKSQTARGLQKMRAALAAERDSERVGTAGRITDSQHPGGGTPGGGSAGGGKGSHRAPARPGWRRARSQDAALPGPASGGPA